MSNNKSNATSASNQRGTEPLSSAQQIVSQQQSPVEHSDNKTAHSTTKSETSISSSVEGIDSKHDHSTSYKSNASLSQVRRMASMPEVAVRSKRKESIDCDAAQTDIEAATMKSKARYVDPTTIYVVDTNVLIFWIQSRQEEMPEWAANDLRRQDGILKKQILAHKILEGDYQNYKIVIPSIVWVELYGVMYQKDIDLDNYVKWRQNRKIILRQLELKLFSDKSNITLGEEELDSELAINLCSHPASSELLEGLRKMYGNRNYPDGRSVSIKGLDGIDSAIIAYAWCYAESHPELKVRVLSDDGGIKLMIEEFKREKKCFGESFPPNLDYQSLWNWRYRYRDR